MFLILIFERDLIYFVKYKVAKMANLLGLQCCAEYLLADNY